MKVEEWYELTKELPIGYAKRLREYISKYYIDKDVIKIELEELSKKGLKTENAFLNGNDEEFIKISTKIELLTNLLKEGE